MPDIDDHLRSASGRLHRGETPPPPQALPAVRARSLTQARARQMRVAAFAATAVLMTGAAAMASRSGAFGGGTIEATSGGSAQGGATSEGSASAAVSSLDIGSGGSASVGGQASVEVPDPGGSLPEVTAPELPSTTSTAVTITLPPTSTATSPPRPTTTATRPPVTLPPVTTTTPTTTPVTNPDGSVAMSLAQAMSLWASHRPARYQMVVKRSCFCVPNYTAPIRVTVENGVLVSGVYEATGAPAGSDVVAGLTIDEIYAAAAAIGPAGSIVELEANATVGYVTRISLDPIPLAADDEMSYSVSSFVNLG